MDTAKNRWRLEKKIYRACTHNNSSEKYIGNDTITNRLIEKGMAGDAAAQFRLVRCFSEESGELRVVEKELMSKMWLQRAAEGGHVPAMLSLGREYLYGDRAFRNCVRGLYWLTKSANLGNVEACNLLGITFYNGQPLKRSRPVAIKWFRRAANLGCLSSITTLADCYRRGIGVGLDLMKCYACYKVIISKSPGDSGSYRRSIREATLTEEQSREVRRLSTRNPESGLYDL